MKWDNQTKEFVAYCFAGFSLISGFGISIAGFIVDPTGQIHDSVLWVLAQALTFCGAICGVTFYVQNTIRKVKSGLSDKIKHAVKKELSEQENNNTEETE